MKVQHRVELTNGRVLLIEEDASAKSLHFALEDAAIKGFPDYYVVEINRDGVLVMTNSGDAVVSLCEDLKPSEESEPCELG